MYLRGDQKEGVGERQKVDDEDREVSDDDDDEAELSDGISNSGIVV